MMAPVTEAPDARAPRTGSRPLATWPTIWWAVLGLALLVVATWLAATRWSVLLAGHPAYPLTVAGAAAVGIVLLVHAVRRPRRPSSGRRWVVVAGRVLAGLVVAAVVATLAWLRPFPASSGAVQAMSGSAGVVVDDGTSRITLTPRATRVGAGLVFQPGARVDPRAYVPLLTRIAEAGFVVVVVKQPYNIGFTAVGAPGDIIEDHPEVDRWAVGGHSLGGVAASSYAGGEGAAVVDGLLLWASYPLDSLAGTDLRVTSISGTRDALATPADIEESRTDLPPDAELVSIEGGVHAYFGDYGEQPGDGTPPTHDDRTEWTPVEASVELLTALAAGR